MNRNNALKLLKDGAEGPAEWNRRRAAFEQIPDLSDANLRGAELRGADLINANLNGADLTGANLRGAKLARDVRETMGRDVFVLGSMGPLGKYLAPLGSVTHEEARAAFLEQAEGLLEGGVDAFVVETFSDLVEVRLAAEAIRAITDLPVIASVAFTQDHVTFLGHTPVEVARTLAPAKP